MKIVIIGAGAMGIAAVFYLLKEMAVTHILLIDNNQHQLTLLIKRLNNLISTQKLQTLCLDVNNSDILSNAIKDYNIIIGTVPWQATIKIIKAALNNNKPFVSITRPDYSELTKLQTEITANQGSIMLGCGLEPGLTEICAHHIIKHFSTLDTLHIRCGGIPLNPIPPLFYKSTFANHQLPIDPRTTYFIEYGELKTTPRFSAIEKINIPTVGQLEAWHDGMLPWLIELPQLKKARLCTQKTLRWPGFAEKIGILTELGLLSQQAIEIAGQSVIPRQVVEAILKPSTTFTDKDRDVVILQLSAYGNLQNKIESTLSMTILDYFDEETGFTAMARTTGYTVAISALLMLADTALAKGLIRPEQFFQADRFTQLISKLAASHININISGRTL